MNFTQRKQRVTEQKVDRVKSEKPKSALDFAEKSVLISWEQSRCSRKDLLVLEKMPFYWVYSDVENPLKSILDFCRKNCYIVIKGVKGIKMTFGEKVLELRLRLQITQKQLAELLGVSYPTVNRWEMGHYKATKLVRRRFDDLCKKHEIQFDDDTTGEQ